LRVARWTAPIVLHIIPIGHPLHTFPAIRTVAVAEIGLRAVDLVAPRIQASIRTAGGFFPLGCGGQALAGPGIVRFGIMPAHLYNWMCLPPGNATPVTPRSTPVGIGYLGPCLRSSAALAPTLAFCLCAIACGLDKLLEAGVRHFVFVDIESVQEDTVLGNFVLEDGAIGLGITAQQTGGVVRARPLQCPAACRRCRPALPPARRCSSSASRECDLQPCSSTDKDNQSPSQSG
jgi:hypothetical protein